MMRPRRVEAVDDGGQVAGPVDDEQAGFADGLEAPVRVRLRPWPGAGA